MPPLPTQLNPVSGKLTPARYLARLPWYLVPALASVAWALLDEDWAMWAWSIAAFLLALTVWQLWLIPHQVRLLGWKVTDEELLITKGKLWHRFTMVPFGRVQYVDVVSGPIDRRYGLKTLRLNTASPSSNARVPGLPADVADKLAKDIAELAKEKMMEL